jgi:hypothetical protein
MNEVIADTTATTVAAPAPAVKAKEPSKKSLALVIFQSALLERQQGLFGNNKEFRSAVLCTIESKLGVTRASASTMYNSAKKDAEQVDATVFLGRDPKKVKAPGTGLRGRPLGSKNKARETLPVVADPVTIAKLVPVDQVASALM